MQQLNNCISSSQYQWAVLPHGMKNSPTICQYSVDKAMQPFFCRYLPVFTFHYIDDTLLGHPGKDYLDKAFYDLQGKLSKQGLYIAPEKLQR